MKTITLESPQLDREWLFNQAGEDALYVSLPDGRNYLLCAVDDGDVEAAQMAANKELMAMLNTRPKKTFSLEEAKVMLGL